MQIKDFQRMKQNGEKISMVTCYDFWSAKIIEASNIDCVLVGDSLAMVMHGYSSTLSATVELMTLHVQAVSRGIKSKLIIGDLPFLSYRKTLSDNMSAVEQIMRAGACAVKLEGEGNEALIRHIVQSGVPVMGHLGLTPQSVHLQNGFCVQAKEKEEGGRLLAAALKLEEAGCFAIVLECIPASLSKRVTDELQIPTIGIGAGSHVSGQVLVMQDCLGMDLDFSPKFLKKYINGFDLAKDAFNQFDVEVKENIFPDKEHSY